MSKFKITFDNIFYWESKFPDEMIHWKIPGYYKSLDEIDENKHKFIDKVEFLDYFKKYYWDLWQADKINNQSIANIVVDWSYTNGIVSQKMSKIALGLHKNTDILDLIRNINKTDQKQFFKTIFSYRYIFYKNLIKKGIKGNFMDNWFERLSSFKYKIS